MVEKIEQHHREQAAANLEKLYPNDSRTAKVAARMRAGECDDHPGIQGSAFYDGANKVYTFRVKGEPVFSVETIGPNSAMGAANFHFKCLPQGAWMENGLNNFFWAEGNFFD